MTPTEKAIRDFCGHHADWWPSSTQVQEMLALAQPAPVQEPCGWQFYQDGKWHNGMDTNNHRANTEAAGIPVRDVYPTPQRTEQEPVIDKSAAIRIATALGWEPKRTWVGLTRAQFAEILCDDRWQGRPELMLLRAQQLLKELNHG